jgi:hypothetical protein
MRQTLDIRYDDTLDVFISKNMNPTAQIVIQIEAKDEDGANAVPGQVHTLTLGSNVYTQGSGLEIIDGKLMWTFTRSAITSDKVEGKLESSATIAGLYYLLNIAVWLK